MRWLSVNFAIGITPGCSLIDLLQRMFVTEIV